MPSPLPHLSCFMICTSWNKIDTLYDISFNIIHFNIVIQYLFTLIRRHSIHSPSKHSLNSTNYLIPSPLPHLSCFKICTSWNKIYTLYDISFNIIHSNIVIQYLYTLIARQSIHYSFKHSLHSTIYLIPSPLPHLSCFKICASWNKIYTLYDISFNIIHFNINIHYLFTLIRRHSIHSPSKHSLFSSN